MCQTYICIVKGDIGKLIGKRKNHRLVKIKNVINWFYWLRVFSLNIQSHSKIEKSCLSFLLMLFYNRKLDSLLSEIVLQIRFNLIWSYKLNINFSTCIFPSDRHPKVKWKILHLNRLWWIDKDSQHSPVRHKKDIF